MARLVRRASAFNDCAGLHLAATATFEGPIAQGATNLAVAAALTLAATPTSTQGLHAAKVARLTDWVAGLPLPLRAHVLTLVDGASAVDAARHGSSPRAGRRRMPGLAFPAAGVDGVALDRAVHLGREGERPGATAACIEAATADDLALVEADVDVIVAGIPFLPRAQRETCLAELEEAAMTLCVRPATSRAEARALRPVLVRLWRVLRRRRPDAAAVLHRKLAADLARPEDAVRAARRRAGAASLATASP